jgi:hypothetical protein
LTTQRSLPLRVQPGPPHRFDGHLVTVVRPGTRPVVQFLVGARWPGWSDLAALCVGIVTATFVGLVAHGALDLAPGPSWVLAATAFVSAFAAREAVIAGAGGRGRLVATVHGSDLDGRRLEACALIELLSARATIREVARGPVGDRLDDDVIDAVETACWEAVMAIRQSSAVLERLAVGPGGVAAVGPEDVMQEWRCHRERVERYRDALTSLARSAHEAHSEHLRLARRDLAGLGDPGDLFEARLTGRLTEGAERLDAYAAAERDLAAVQLTSGEESGTPPTRRV